MPAKKTLPKKSAAPSRKPVKSKSASTPVKQLPLPEKKMPKRLPGEKDSEYAMRLAGPALQRKKTSPSSDDDQTAIKIKVLPTRADFLDVARYIVRNAWRLNTERPEKDDTVSGFAARLPR